MLPVLVSPNCFGVLSRLMAGLVYVSTNISKNFVRFAV